MPGAGLAADGCARFHRFDLPMKTPSSHNVPRSPLHFPGALARRTTRPVRPMNRYFLSPAFATLRRPSFFSGAAGRQIIRNRSSKSAALPPPRGDGSAGCRLFSQTTFRAAACLPIALFICCAAAQGQTDTTQNITQLGDYPITVRGADGGYDTYGKGGSGATVAATFSLQPGDVLTRVTGIAGRPAQDGMSGGGGSAVILTRGLTKTLLIVAGAGGGGLRLASADGGRAGQGTAGGGAGGFGGGGGGFNAAGGTNSPSYGHGGGAGTLAGGAAGGAGGFSGADGSYGFGGGGGGQQSGGGGGGGYGGGNGGVGNGDYQGTGGGIGGSSFVEASGFNVGRSDGSFGGSTGQNGSVSIGFQPPVADLTVTKIHTGSFVQGQTGKTYSIAVRNSGPVATSGTVSVVDTLPSGLTATAISGTGWTCTLATLTCTRTDALAAGSSYPAITLTVNLDVNAPSSVTNIATVSGGGERNTGNSTGIRPDNSCNILPDCRENSHRQFRAGRHREDLLDRRPQQRRGCDERDRFGN